MSEIILNMLKLHKTAFTKWKKGGGEGRGILNIWSHKNFAELSLEFDQGDFTVV